MRVALMFLVAVLGLTVACGGGGGADQPPTINYGRDTSAMGMIISDPRFAGATVDARGRATLFDDLGDLVVAARQNQTSSTRVWVHDYQTRRWIDGTTASYVAADGLVSVTPMGSGLVAFQGQADAASFSRDHHGTEMSWTTVLSTWKNPTSG